MKIIHRAEAQIAFLVTDDIRLAVGGGGEPEVKPIHYVTWCTTYSAGIDFYIHEVTAFAEDGMNVTIASVYHPDEEIAPRSWVPRPPEGWDKAVRDLATQNLTGVA